MKSFVGSDAKLEALMKRQGAVAAAVRAERQRRKVSIEKDRARLVGIIGRAVLANAAQSAEFKEFLKGILRSTVTAEAEVKFLKAQNFYE